MLYSSSFCHRFTIVLSKTYNWKIYKKILVIKTFSKKKNFYIPYLPYGSLNEKELRYEIQENKFKNYSFKTLDLNNKLNLFDKDSRVTMRIKNSFSSINNFWDSLHHKDRNIIRKTEKNNLKEIKCKNNKELKEFYLILTKSFNNHGTPIPRFKLFLNLFNEQLCDFYIIKFKHKVIGSFCCFYDNKLSTLLYLNVDNKYKYLNTADFIVWKFINIYFKKTLLFDLGTCKYLSGNYLFKKNI